MLFWFVFLLELEEVFEQPEFNTEILVSLYITKIKWVGQRYTFVSLLPPPVFVLTGILIVDFLGGTLVAKRKIT